MIIVIVIVIVIVIIIIIIIIIIIFSYKGYVEFDLLFVWCFPALYSLQFEISFD